MRAHYIQHVPFEGPGCIEPWLTANNHEISATKIYDDSSFPKTNEIDFLIILGGPMSVNDDKTLNWIKKEKAYIDRYIKAYKPLLGLCLGAQMIASVLGSKIYKNKHKEIGWLPISGELINQDVFHWHGETFDIPDGAKQIAESKGCRNQGFVYNKKTYAFQFHLETTPDAVKKLIINCGDELKENGQYIQKENEILALTEKYYKQANMTMEKMLKLITSAA